MREPDDGVHRRSDVVAHIGEERALGLACRKRRFGRLFELVLSAEQRLLSFLSAVDIAPRAHHFERLAVRVANEMLLVADPAIGTVFLAEPIFGKMRSRLEELRMLGLYRGKVFRVNMRAPERRILQIFFGTVPEQARDVVADEGGGEVAARRKT